MHRDDIDGLRTLAVLPVIAFHFIIWPKLSGGGFVGVDIFFVISGYLITHTICRDLDNGTYTIVEFYNRRIRRIFPALFMIFVFCIIITFFLTFPSEANNISRSIISSIFFVSNFVFYAQSGYFDRDSETNPLLHMWSLSVEEQFYIVFPLLIYLMRAVKSRATIPVLCALAVGSLLLSIWEVYTDSAAAFFLVQFRAWELLIGSLLAMNVVPKLVRQWQAEALGLCGIATIVASVVLISKNAAFPGLAALPPCLGAAAVIHSSAATKTLTGRMLAFFPIRFIGLISYSLYLWHWPIFVFYRLFVGEPSRIEKGALVVLCFLAATISWRLIERPFREKPYKLKAYGTVLAGGIVMASTAAAAFALGTVMESVYTYPRRATEVLSYAKIDEGHLRPGTCFVLSSANGLDYRNGCLDIKPYRSTFLIVGDSHAAQLWLGLQTSYPAINFLQATAAGCVPVVGDKSRGPVCSEIMRYVFEKFIPGVHLDGIIIAARWQIETSWQEIINTANAARFYANRVIIFGPIVEYDQALPRILARAIASSRSEAAFAERHRVGFTEEIDRRFSTALQGGPVEYVSVYQALCAQACEIWAAKDVPLQFDNTHLTCEGSMELARKVGPRLFPDIPLAVAHADECAAGRRIDGPGTASARRSFFGALPGP